jgi:putative transposase
MWYTYHFRAYPDQTGVAAEVERHIDIHRHAYNHTRYEYNALNTDEANIGSAYQHQKRLPEWTDEWTVFSEVHSKALQKTVERFYDNLSNFSEKKQSGHNVGWLKGKSAREYQSVTCSQSGFELKNTSGRTATLWLSKIGDIPIRYHRTVPDNAIIKEVTLKKETTGEWYVTFGLEVQDTSLPEKPDVDDLDAEDCVGIDLGINTTSGRAMATAWTGSISSTSTTACDGNSVVSPPRNTAVTTGRNNAGRSQRSSVGSSGR